MHFAGQPQVYPVCIQADVSSSGTFVPTDTVTFPEAYHSESLSLDYETFNVNQSDTQKFTCPGPAVEDFSGASGSADSVTTGAASSAAADSPAASSPTSDAPSASSTDNEIASPSQSDSLPAGNPESGNSSDSPVDPVSDILPAPTGGTASSSAAMGSDTAPAGEVSSVSSSGRGRGRHSRRPGQPRCVSQHFLMT